MSLGGQHTREDEILDALQVYLEIVEGGGDGEAYLSRNPSIEPELRSLIRLESYLEVEVPREALAGQARNYRRFRETIANDRATAQKLMWFKPRLFGIIGALGLGLGLTGAFASGTLPSGPVGNAFHSIPVIGSIASGPGNNPSVVELPPFPAQRIVSPTQTSPLLSPARSTESNPKPAVTTAPPFPLAGSTERPPLSFTPGSAASATATPPATEAPTFQNSEQVVSSELGPPETPPGQGGENPGVGDDPPGPPSENPGQGANPPGPPSENPGVGDEPPGPPAESPGQGANPPEPPSENPGVGDEPPGPPAENPGVGDDPPGPPAENPGVGEDPPGPPDENPGQGGNPPGRN